jgi:hypothetical protein
VLKTVGRSVLAKAFEHSVKAIEQRYATAKANGGASALSPCQPSGDWRAKILLMSGGRPSRQQIGREGGPHPGTQTAWSAILERTKP